MHRHARACRPLGYVASGPRAFFLAGRYDHKCAQELTLCMQPKLPARCGGCQQDLADVLTVQPVYSSIRGILLFHLEQGILGETLVHMETLCHGRASCFVCGVRLDVGFGFHTSPAGLHLRIGELPAPLWTLWQLGSTPHASTEQVWRGTPSLSQGATCVSITAR